MYSTRAWSQQLVRVADTVVLSQNDRHSRQMIEDARAAGKFELYKDSAGKFRFRLKAGNGEIVATGEAYESKANLLRGVKDVQRAADGATIDDKTAQ